MCNRNYAQQRYNKIKKYELSKVKIKRTLCYRQLGPRHSGDGAEDIATTASGETFG